MGAALVGAALNPHWAKLNETERLVLLTMALTALDTPSRGRPARIYWAGQEYLMLVIHGHIPPPRTVEYETVRRRIRRATRTLQQHGAIEQIAPANGHRRARYELHLDQFDQPEIPVDDPT